MRRDGMKVGILTYHRSVNYGAYLQALALCKKLNCEQDISAEIIDFRMKCDEFKCVYEVDGECDQDGGECIGDMCECFGECTDCQEQDRNECDGIR